MVKWYVIGQAVGFYGMAALFSGFLGGMIESDLSQQSYDQDILRDKVEACTVPIVQEYRDFEHAIFSLETAASTPRREAAIAQLKTTLDEIAQDPNYVSAQSECYAKTQSFEKDQEQREEFPFYGFGFGALIGVGLLYNMTRRKEE